MGLKLGDVSPLAGILTGEGAIGKIAGEGMLGLGPQMIASQAQDSDKDRDRRKALERSMAGKQTDGATPTVKTMKKGGAVKVSKASSRADGCAKRGKTRGRMV
jgi:hypothetical protein